MAAWAANAPTKRRLHALGLLYDGLRSRAQLGPYPALCTPQVNNYDLPRAARMGSFGFFFYGPYQHYWYR